MKYISITLALLGVTGAIKINQRNNIQAPPVSLETLLRLRNGDDGNGTTYDNGTYGNDTTYDNGTDGNGTQPDENDGNHDNNDGDDQKAEVIAWLKKALMVTTKLELTKEQLFEALEDYVKSKGITVPGDELRKFTDHIFQKVDTDNSQAISVAELEAALTMDFNNDGGENSNEDGDNNGDDEKLPDKGQMIDIVMWLSQALEASSEKTLDLDQTFEVAKAYVASKAMNVSDEDLKEGTNKIFSMVDQDGNGKVTKKELLSSLFKIIDRDQNQHLSKCDIKKIVKAYAKFLNITLKPEWKKEITKWYSAVDKGVSQEELMAFLQHHGESIHSLESAVRSLDKNFKHDDQDGHDDDDSHKDEGHDDDDSHKDEGHDDDDSHKDDGHDDDDSHKDDGNDDDDSHQDDGHDDDDSHKDDGHDDDDSHQDDGDDESHNDGGDDHEGDDENVLTKMW